MRKPRKSCVFPDRHDSNTWALRSLLRKGKQLWCRAEHCTGPPLLPAGWGTLMLGLTAALQEVRVSRHGSTRLRQPFTGPRPAGRVPRPSGICTHSKMERMDLLLHALSLQTGGKPGLHGSSCQEAGCSFGIRALHSNP